MRGRLVAFEGGDASGKSTQAARLAQRLGALLTREPGGTEAGRVIRRLLLDPGTAGLDARAEALLMAADRAQHVAEVVGPALAAGRDVVTDRFCGSSLAYQGHGRGLAIEEVAHLSAWATAGLCADLVVLLDVDERTAATRRGGDPARDDPDRLEAEDAGFRRRVRAGYLELAAAHPDRWVVVDGTGTVEAVAGRVDTAVAERLRGRGGRP